MSSRFTMHPYAGDYAAIHEFLEPWCELWRHSVFHRFAEMERLVPDSWFRFGETEGLPSQHVIGRGEPHSRAPKSLLAWIRGIRGLCVIPRIGEYREIPSPLSRGLTPKKRHEIEAVLGFFRSEGVSILSVLDIGGGMGHLARHLALELGCSVDSIDRDRALQRKGQDILRKAPWRVALQHPVRFVPGEFPGTGCWDPPGEGAWAVGLHTCGQTAWSQLALARQGYSVLNVGCCYEKLDVTTGTQRSRAARELPLMLTDEALFLANRGGVERTLEEFVFQQRVLRYRFTLHELLTRHGCDARQGESVGSASTAAYLGSFPDYARDRLRHLEGLPSSLRSLSSAALEEARISMEPKIERMRFIAFLRNLLARPLEIAILLDRALFVLEQAQDCEVRMLRFFDPEISPRNVGLVVRGHSKHLLRENARPLLGYEG